MLAAIMSAMDFFMDGSFVINLHAAHLFAKIFRRGAGNGKATLAGRLSCGGGRGWLNEGLGAFGS